MKTLSATRWQHIEGYLDAILERPLEERLACLEDLRLDDRQLHDDLEALIGAYNDAPEYLENNVSLLAETLLPERAVSSPQTPTELDQQTIGPYRLTGLLGRGGMGVVYKAHRNDGTYDHEVAIKLLASSHHDSVARDRFDQERQVLALLNHPNIARLYDGGITDQGQSYIVMEYVDGIPITEYCARHRLGIRKRLGFIRQVAASLQHAHSHLIVHRDIKPGNILVTDDGTVKLLDFGIAKLLGLDDVGSNLTMTGEQLLTPSFAAPEQVKGQAVTIATDVYQLGVVLFELLTGQQPFASANSFYEMARVVCDKTPERPSDSVQPERVGVNVGMDVERWHKTLRGDLDAITLKALRKAPEDRYGSVEALIADLNAYEQARPVVAREHSTLYHASKFIQRHAFGVATSLCVLALVVAYSITSVVQSNRVERALAQATIESQKSWQVARFLTDMFKVSDPNVPGSQQMTAGELLDQGRARLDKELSTVPEVRAQMLHVMGEIYYSLGAYDDSVAVLESAVLIRQALLPANDPGIATSLMNLAFAYNATDQYALAQRSLEQALSIHEAAGTENVERAEILNALADVQRMQANHDKAEKLFLQAIAILRRITDGNHAELATGLQGLAMLQLVSGDAQNAEANSREAVKVVKNTLGEKHSYYTSALNGLGLLLAYLERHEEAEPLHLQALEIQQEVLGEKHPYVAQTSGYLGFLANRRGRFAQAEQHYRQAISIQQALDGDGSASLARLFGQLASVLTELERFDEAEQLLNKTLEIDRAIFAKDSPTIGRDLAKRAALEHARGNTDAAAQDYAKALKLLPAKGARTAEAQLKFAQLKLELNELADAESLAQAALTSRLQDLPPGHSMIREAQQVLAAIRAR